MLYDLSSCGLSLSSEKALVTVPKVIASLPDPELLYEMEAAGIFLAASRFCPPHRMFFLKYVSDSGEEDPKKEPERFAACVKWVKENAPEYWLDWTPFDHPVFGQVEIGGFCTKFTHQNPPKKFLKDLMEQV